MDDLIFKVRNQMDSIERALKKKRETEKQRAISYLKDDFKRAMKNFKKEDLKLFVANVCYSIGHASTKEDLIFLKRKNFKVSYNIETEEVRVWETVIYEII